MNSANAVPPTDRFFWTAFAVTAVLQVVLALLIPVTGDEAYFVVWGEHPDYGYYDHGPMTGWWLAFALLMGKNALTIRLLAILATLAVGWLLFRFLRPVDHARAGLAAGLFLWSPHNILNVFMTTDVPLLFFSVVSGIFATRAWRQDRSSDYLLAGLFLGLAFLSKYFAVVLGFSYAVLLLFFSGRPRVRGLLLILAGVLPSAVLNVVWNYHHGWANILFNFFTRQEESGISIFTLLEYLGIVLLLLGPLAYFLLAPSATGRTPWRRLWDTCDVAGLRPFLLMFAVPHIVFFAVSIFQSVGVHWLLSFYPFLFGTLVCLFSTDGLYRMIRPMQVFTGVLVVLTAVVASLPVTLASGHGSYPTIVIGTHPKAVIEAIESTSPGFRLATPSYTRSALLNLHYDDYVPVIASYSYHGRQDDLIADFREFDGADFAVVVTRREVQKISALFDSFELVEVDVMGARLPVIYGRGFKFDDYRDYSLQWIADRYYRIPPWLARWSPPPFFLEKYDLEHLPVEDELPDPRRKGRRD